MQGDETWRIGYSVEDWRSQLQIWEESGVFNSMESKGNNVEGETKKKQQEEA